jgi:uncharacterized membrane protein YgcG
MYYPQSQITPNLYANEGELVTKKNKKPYSGPYYLVSNGKKFAGATPSDISIELIPDPQLEVDEEKSRYTTISINLQDGDPDPTSLSPAEDVTTPNLDSGTIFNEINNRAYSNLSFDSKPKNRTLPLTFTTKPNLQDNRVGYYLRYFAKKTNENIFIETNLETYKKFTSQDPKVAFDLYEMLSLTWMLKSKTKNIVEINKKTVKDIEINKNWKGFYSWFNNGFGKRGKPTRYLYTNGNELLLPNRTNYIGYYHIMENIGYMSGKYHGDGPENILIPTVKNLTPIYKLSGDSSQENISPSSTANQSSTTQTSSPSSGGGYSGGGGGGY